MLAVTASNTWGLTLLVLMWGYGLVEVPRRLWNSAHRGRMLSYTYFKIAKLSLERTEADENLEDVLDVCMDSALSMAFASKFLSVCEFLLIKSDP